MRLWSRILAVVLVVVGIAILVIPTPRQVEASAAAQPFRDGDASVAPAGARVLPTATSRRTLQGDFESYAATVVPSGIDVYTAPDATSDVRMRMANTTEHGQPQTLLVVKEIYVDGATWYEVMLPIRPNGATGWVRGADVRVSGLPYSVQVSLGAKQLDVYRQGQPVASYPVGIGRERYPTPGGTFYMMELLRPPDPKGPYGTRTYVLNGFSAILKSFNGGAGSLGIHGTNEPATVGTDVSHGCIRMRNSDIEAIAAILPLGTPVRILT